MNRADVHHAHAAARLLRLPEVRHLTGLSTSTLYALMADGTFPRPVKLTERSVAWPERLVADWISTRLSAVPAAGGAT